MFNLFESGQFFIKYLKKTKNMRIMQNYRQFIKKNWTNDFVNGA